MFACPGEPDKVIYTCDGMTFRSSQPAYAGTTHGFKEESPPEKLAASIPVPMQLAGKVIGKKKANIQMLRRQTKCKITVAEATGFSNIIIMSDSQEKLDAAVEQVKAFIEAISKEQPFTHFVAIPCAYRFRAENRHPLSDF